MAFRNGFTHGNHDFDIEQLLLEAQHRWLRAPEICEILRNYKRFNIAPEPPNMPPSGSLFLFDRKVLRYFRKDGHRWRKKKDGKTIKEAHERLKVGSIDVLHCYYAHGEDNENFQRRSYWMLEEKLSHIVLVHYREVKGYKTNFNRFKETEEATVYASETEQGVCHSEAKSNLNSGLQQNSCQVTFHNTVARSLNGARALDYEDAESGSFQENPTTVSSLEIDEDQSSQKHHKEDALESHNIAVQSASVKSSLFNVQSNSLHVISKQENVLAMHLLTDPVRESQASRELVQGQKNWQLSGEDAMHFGSGCKLSNSFMPNVHDQVIIDSMCMDRQALDTMDHLNNQPSVSACLEGQSDVKSNLSVGKKSSHIASRMLLDRPVKVEVLKKCDSFNQWMCKELGDVEPVMPSSGAYLDADDKRSECPVSLPVAEFNSYTHGSSLSQEQLFRIIDFAPNWGYANSETKVLITGKFLNTQPDTRIKQWSCMFGEKEVPAEVIADGVLRCYAPPHGVARVQLYVTCSNRIACSDVKEFEYREKSINNFDSTFLSNRHDALQVRFCKLLSLGSSFCRNSQPCSWASSSNLLDESSSLLKGAGSEWFQILELTSKEKFSLDEVKDKLAEKLMKEKLYEWLLFNEVEGGNGLRGWDENGQGVLHLAAALGYDWAISPIAAAGVSINFRDVCGWTALHWAAYYGRERTVAYLISLGAYAGALTDPTPTNPLGRTSADLASENGHKGIAGFLAESALSGHLESITLKDETKHNSPVEPHVMASVLTSAERMATSVSGEDNLDGLSLKYSLAALCNATQAAARIHQVYRSHSFSKKQRSKFGSDKIETSDEYALSVITLKSHKKGQYDEPVHAAAVRIQNKFRSWKGRREYLKLRKKIVHIQAHIRGHQVRKHYKEFLWSVGIVEKVILRWRRRRSGLRGFKSEYSTGKSQYLKDEYDFLKQGRKQSEERLQKALSRVKSMVRYPEARDQYRRLLTIVQEIKEMKDGCCSASDGTNDTVSMEDDLVDLDTLLNGGTFQ